jgi:hypothetical protein
MHFRQGQIEAKRLFFNEGSLVRPRHLRKGLLEGEAIDYDREGTKVQSATTRPTCSKVAAQVSGRTGR